MEMQIVIFSLAGEHFGVAIQAVEGIIKMQTITRVPQSPEFVEGVTHLRGKVLPVIDLRRRLGLSEGGQTAETRIVVVSLAGREVGMIVDEVSEVLTIADSVIEPAPEMTLGVDVTFITGIARLTHANGEPRLVILLDLSHVLKLGEQEQLAALPAA